MLNQRDRSLVTNLLSNFNYFGEQTDKNFERDRELFRRFILADIELSEVDFRLFKLFEEELGSIDLQKDNLYGPIVILLVLKYVLSEELSNDIENIIYDTFKINKLSQDTSFTRNDLFFSYTSDELIFASSWCNDFIVMNDEEGFDFDLRDFIYNKLGKVKQLHKKNNKTLL